MLGVMIFKIGDRQLLRYEFPLNDKEAIGPLIAEGCDEFRRAHPDVSLMDGVTVVFDKAD